MIKLDDQYVTQIQTVTGGQTVNTVTTDTLYLSQIAFDFVLGAVYATIQRGTVVDGVFTENQPPYVVSVNTYDGSFTVLNGNGGTVPGLSSFIAAIKGQLDAFILSSGLVTGTAG